MTPTKTLCGESLRSPAAPAEADDIAVPAQYVIYCQSVCVCVHVCAREIWAGVQDVPTVTRLSVRKECIVWTSLMSWASPKVKYATSLPASAAAMSWINAAKEASRTKRLLLVLLVLVVMVVMLITQLIFITLKIFKVSLHHVRKQGAKITVN